MTDEDKIKIYERYRDDGISEEVTRLLLGEEFDILQEDIEEFRDTVEGHTSEYPI